MLKTGINLSDFGFNINTDGCMKVIRSIGFDSFFTGWDHNEERIYTLRNTAEKYGLIYESIHAPFSKINCMWEEGDSGIEYRDKLKTCVDDCVKSGVKYLTVHVMHIPDTATWSETGVKRFQEVVNYAWHNSIKITFENVEYPECQLKRIIGVLRETNPGEFGFCWDTGHEHCYTSEDDIAELYGDLICCTHMHDNLGQITPPKITWHDDIHIMPFDGTLNYVDVGRKIKKCRFNGCITLEISRSERQWGVIPWYKDLTYEEYIELAYDKAVKIAKLCE